MCVCGGREEADVGGGGGGGEEERIVRDRQTDGHRKTETDVNANKQLSG